jgi:hypothetical protein
VPVEVAEPDRRAARRGYADDEADLRLDVQAVRRTVHEPKVVEVRGSWVMTNIGS